MFIFTTCIRNIMCVMKDKLRIQFPIYRIWCYWVEAFSLTLPYCHLIFCSFMLQDNFSSHVFLQIGFLVQIKMQYMINLNNLISSQNIYYLKKVLTCYTITINLKKSFWVWSEVCTNKWIIFQVVIEIDVAEYVCFVTRFFVF